MQKSALVSKSKLSVLHACLDSSFVMSFIVMQLWGIIFLFFLFVRAGFSSLGRVSLWESDHSNGIDEKKVDVCDWCLFRFFVFFCIS